MLKQESKGFTLIEIIIAIVIIAIVAGIAAKIVLQGMRAFSDEDQRSNLHYQTKLAVERIAREARVIRSCADIVGPIINPSNTLSFTDVLGNPMVFTVAGTNLNRNGNHLANGIQSPTPFRYLDQSGNPTVTCVAPNNIWFIEIDVTDTQGSETLQMRTRVHPMNF
jgi:prepilin-type N-terminal cleavage/methylation domain-containing protein